jgi:hypothetical protein
MLNEQNLINYLDNINDLFVNIKDILLYDIRSRANHKNPLNSYGKKVFSQTDEDGITLEIMKRIGINRGVFAEFGVGNGMENNTLVLAALGWTGFWVDGDKPHINLQQVTNPRFAIMTRFVTLDNVEDTIREGLSYTSNGPVDFISFDFEGNDYYLIERLLENGVNPSVWLVEYNGKFIPPIDWKVDYHPDNRWCYDDYFGASLMSYTKLFEQHGYFLACCNSFTGANAYFIRDDHRNVFRDIPDNINDIWVEPRYYLPGKYGHSSSQRTVEIILNGLNSIPADE